MWSALALRGVPLKKPRHPPKHPALQRSARWPQLLRGEFDPVHSATKGREVGVDIARMAPSVSVPRDLHGDFSSHAI